MRRSIPPDCGSSSEKRIVFIALPAAHRHRPAAQVHILDPQPDQLTQPQSRPILQPRRQLIAGPHVIEELRSLLRGKHHRHPLLRLLQLHIKPRILHPTDLLEKERQGIESLFLRRKRPKACRPFGQERSDVPRRGEQAGGACESIGALLIVHQGRQKARRRLHLHRLLHRPSEPPITRRPGPVTHLRS